MSWICWGFSTLCRCVAELVVHLLQETVEASGACVCTASWTLTDQHETWDQKHVRDTDRRKDNCFSACRRIRATSTPRSASVSNGHARLYVRLFAVFQPCSLSLTLWNTGPDESQLRDRIVNADDITCLRRQQRCSTTPSRLSHRSCAALIQARQRRFFRHVGKDGRLAWHSRASSASIGGLAKDWRRRRVCDVAHLPADVRRPSTMDWT